MTPSGLHGVRLEAIDLDRLWSQIQEVKSVADSLSRPAVEPVKESSESCPLFGHIRIARLNTLTACNIVEENYSDYLIVFSGRKGFHILLPFSAEDWTHYRAMDPLKTQAAARFKYALYLKHRGVWFDHIQQVRDEWIHRVNKIFHGTAGRP
mgnify:CR=1 FL=1